MPRITAPKPHWLAALLSLLWMGSASLQAAPQLTPLHNRPVAFEENRGQTDPQVKYLSRGQGYTLFLTPEEAVLALYGAGQTGSILRLRWVDGVASPRMTADGPLPGVTHHLTGNDPSRWRTGVPSWTRVRYQEVWPGIDLIFYGNPRQLEYDVVVAPGADPGRVRLAFDGAEELRLEPAGDLVVRVGGEEVRLRRPVSSQEVNGIRGSIESSWRLVPGALEAGFRVGAYDRSRPLVIDPVLVYSTYLGGSAEDEISAVAVDAAGNTYVTGDTDSFDFPVAGTIQPLRTRDAFVSKLDPNGELVWSTLLGGEDFDAGFGITVDAEGHVAVAGATHSADFSRIGTSLPLPPPQGLISDLFIARLDPSGSSLLWSARIGGSDLDGASGLAVDPAGHLYVVGSTLSRDFPVHAALQPSVADVYNTFLMKLTPDGAFVYSTYLGGGNIDYAMDIAADSTGSAYVVGATNSSDFPTRNAAQPALRGGGGDAFILRVTSDGS
ncbi:MAG TPA: SBBP repeat-containing protein, partial [Thermoanaerobaculia bacterium]|nr:SBBP repeat-containing protein [Thermoanaerobaculia bacterium]